MTTLLDDSVAQALLSTIITGKGPNSYVTNNKVEGNSVIAYLKGGTRPTTVSITTAMGKHLVSLEDARRAGYAPPVVLPTPGKDGYSQDKYSEGPYSK